jgi:hypothetical protein
MQTRVGAYRIRPMQAMMDVFCRGVGDDEYFSRVMWARAYAIRHYEKTFRTNNY